MASVLVRTFVLVIRIIRSKIRSACPYAKTDAETETVLLQINVTAKMATKRLMITAVTPCALADARTVSVVHPTNVPVMLGTTKQVRIVVPRFVKTPV